MLLLKMAFLPMLLKILSKTGRPFFCSTMWVLLILSNGLIFNLAMGTTWLTVGVTCLVELAAASLYFWLVHTLDGAGGIYWGVLAIGMLLMLLMPEINLDPPAKPGPAVAVPSGMPSSLPDALHRIQQQGGETSP